MPVHLWLEEEGLTASPEKVNKLAARFPKATVHQVKQAGRLLYLQHIREILEVSLW